LFQASRRQLPEGKAPLLVAVLVSINKSLPDATVTLKDLTGGHVGNCASFIYTLSCSLIMK